MTTAIVLSKDRAAQCHAFLESLHANCKLFDEVYVLYKASTPDFEKGYELLQSRFETVEFFCETIFREDVLKLVQESDKHVSFFVDDNLFYRPASNLLPSDIDAAFESMPELGCISLRLGDNTYIQDIYNKTLTVFPKQVDQFGEFFVWDWRTVPQHMNFGYPLSVDGTIFKRPVILDILRKTEFTGPNQMEGNIQRHLSTFPRLMACLEMSTVVNSPTNRVQDVFKNNAGQFHGATAEELNQQYLNNKKMKFKEVFIASCHQELEFSFEEV